MKRRTPPLTPPGEALLYFGRGYEGLCVAKIAHLRVWELLEHMVSGDLLLCAPRCGLPTCREDRRDLATFGQLTRSGSSPVFTGPAGFGDALRKSSGLLCEKNTEIPIFPKYSESAVNIE